MRRLSPIFLALLPCLVAGDLTFEDRVRAQAAIEQVYWDHRTWPVENGTPKPPLAAVLRDADLSRDGGGPS